MSVRIRAAVEAGDLSERQRTLVADVLLVAETLAALEPTEYRRQDETLVELREAWKRLEESLPGATTVFAAHRG